MEVASNCCCLVLLALQCAGLRWNLLGVEANTMNSLCMLPPHIHADTIRGLAIATLVIGVLQLVMTYGYVDAILSIAVGACILQALNSGPTVEDKIRNIAMYGSLNCICIAHLVLASLSVLIFGAVFFTVGVIM